MERRALLTATPMDFNGDGKADFYVYDQATATFNYSYSNSPNVSHSLQLGTPNDLNVVTVADYDGDGKADFSVYDQTTATFHTQLSSSGTVQSVSIGDPTHAASVVPVPADYTGDGRTDYAIYDKTGATYFVKPSSNPVTTLSVQIGDPTHVNSITPVPGDYNGDGKADFAIYDSTGAIYYVKPSSNPNTFVAVQIGDPSHVNSIVPVPADYTGDGRTDFAIYDKTAAIYYVKPSSNPNTFVAVQIGDASHVASITPVPADYNGDGRADYAIYDGTGAIYYVKPSGNVNAVITSRVGGTSHVYEPIGGSKADINFSSTTDSLILYDHTTSTFIAPQLPSTINGQAPRPNTLQFGDPSHDNVPVINANISINGDKANNPLILYDRTTSTFIAPPLSNGIGGLPSRPNTLQFGNPSHDNVPIVNASLDLNGDGKADPLILYDRTTSTFIAPPVSVGLGATPPPNTLQVGNPSHNNVPIVNAKVSINGNSTTNPLMVYDRTTSTFVAPLLFAGQTPRPNTLQLGDPTHQNIPVINAAANLNGDNANDPLIVYDQTTSTFISPLIPSGAPGVPPLPNTFQLGNPAHVNQPIINSGANLNGDGAADPLIVFDPVLSYFFSPQLPSAPNQPARPFYLQLGNPSHKDVPIVASGADINSSAANNPLIVYDPIASLFIAPPLTNVPAGQAPPNTLAIGTYSPGARQILPGRRYVFSQTT